MLRNRGFAIFLKAPLVRHKVTVFGVDASMGACLFNDAARLNFDESLQPGRDGEMQLTADFLAYSRDFDFTLFREVLRVKRQKTDVLFVMRKRV